MAGPIKAVLGFFGAMLLVVVAVVLFQMGLIGESPSSTSSGTSDRPAEIDERTDDDPEPGPATDPDSGSDSDSADGSSQLEPVNIDGGEPADLIRVIDGDSLELEIDGMAVDVRIEGINAPELFGDDGRTCNGIAAKDALAELVAGRPLLILGDETDRFGRRLGDVIVDFADASGARSVATALVESGNALATGEAPGLRETMKGAAAAGRGLWGDGCGIRGASGLVIGDTQVDPPGSDRDNLDDEWVTVVNDGAQTVDLVGWVIADDTTGHRFDLGGELAPGAVLTVRSGAGNSSGSDFFLDETFPVWSNRGETVMLIDPAGVVFTWRFIDP